MSDNPDYHTYKDLFEEDIDGFGLNTWVGIIAGVLSGLSLLTIAGVYLSQRKCCRQKNKDNESIILRKRMQLEQKKMATYKCKLPFIEQPSCASIMQQEENDIADEVKEMYSKISTDISKPIICCPEKKASYCYNPKSPSTTSNESDKKINFTDRKLMIEKVIKSINKNLCETEKLDTTCVQEIASGALQKIAKSPFDKRSERSSIQATRFSFDVNSPDFVDSIESEGKKFVVNTENNILLGSNNGLEKEEQEEDLIEDLIQQFTKSPSKVKSSKNLFTESEIHNAADMKSLFFEKWMKYAVDEGDEISEESILKDASMSYDDVDSVLTSISRMDSSRMRKLKNTRFYQKMVFGMQPIRSESALNNLNESLDEKVDSLVGESSLDNRDLSSSTSDHLHLTQEELNQIALNDNQNDSRRFNQPKTRPKQDGSTVSAKMTVLTDMSNDEVGEKRKKEIDDISDDFFRVLPPTSSPNNGSAILKNIVMRKCSSCSDISRNNIKQDIYEKDKKTINNKTKTGNKPVEKHCTTPPPPPSPLPLTPIHHNKLINWSKTRSNDDKTHDNAKSLADTDYTKTNKSDWSSSYRTHNTSHSSCSCSTKTTTWEEIAQKEKEKLFRINNNSSLSEMEEGGEGRDSTKTDVYYIVSNNNCFLLPVINEKSACNESDDTQTSYHLREKRKSLNDSNARNTT